MTQACRLPCMVESMCYNPKGHIGRYPPEPEEKDVNPRDQEYGQSETSSNARIKGRCPHGSYTLYTLYLRVGREHGRFSLLPNTQYLWNLEQLSHSISHPSSKHTWPKGTKRNITHLHWQPSETSIILQESRECTSPQDLTLPTKWK